MQRVKVLLLFVVLLSGLFAACARQSAFETLTEVTSGQAAVGGNAIAKSTADSQSCQPAATVEPHVLARQMIEQATFSAPNGWQVQPCEGAAPFLCIEDAQATVGSVELLIFPLAGYAEDHPVRLATYDLPANPADYTVAQKRTVHRALAALAEEHLEIIATDRATTYPDDTFTPLAFEPAQMGILPALAFGFVHSDPAGDVVVERYLNVAAFDQNAIYWFGINYDPLNVSTFVSDEALTQFSPYFRQIAATLPVASVSVPQGMCKE